MADVVCDKRVVQRNIESLRADSHIIDEPERLVEVLREIWFAIPGSR
jgi:hypothetical protein